jgi:hypothetical protein
MAIPSFSSTVVARAAAALYGLQLGYATMNSVMAEANVPGSGGVNALIDGVYARDFGNATTTSVAQRVVANLGITGAGAPDAVAYVQDLLDNTPAANRGSAVAEAVALFSTLDTHPVYGAAASAFNGRIAAAVAYGQTPGTFDREFNLGASLGLTLGVDFLTGTPSNDTIVARIFDNSNSLQSGDTVNGGAGSDRLEADMGTSAAFAVTPETTNVETIAIRAQAHQNDSGDNNVAGPQRVKIDAERIVGAQRFESNNSRADVIIEDVRILPSQITKDITVAFVESDPGHVDYALYFDQYSLRNQVSNTSSINLQIMDTVAAAAGEAPLKESNYGAFTFTVTIGGVSRVVTLGSQAIQDAQTYAEMAAAFQAALDAEFGPGVASATVGDNFTVVDPASRIAVTGQNIVLTTNTAATFSTPAGSGWLASGTAPAASNFYTNYFTGTTASASLVTSTVILDDVGRGSTGGDLVIGGLSVGSTSSSLGVQRFEIEVQDNSKLESINSTNNTLREVTIKNGLTSNSGYAYVTTTKDAGNLTVNGNSGTNGQNVSGQSNRVTVGTATDDATGINAVMPGVQSTTQGGAAIQTFGFTDVRLIDATEMRGKFEFTAQVTSASLAKYLNLKDIQTNPAGDNIAFTYNGGTNDDTMWIRLDSNAVASRNTIMVGREDFTFTANGGAGNDWINVAIPLYTTDPLGPVVALIGGDQAWYTNQKLNKNITLDGGAGDDVIRKPGAGDFTILGGTGLDTVYADNSGAQTVTNGQANLAGAVYTASEAAELAAALAMGTLQNNTDAALTAAALANLNTLDLVTPVEWNDPAAPTAGLDAQPTRAVIQAAIEAALAADAITPAQAIALAAAYNTRTAASTITTPNSLVEPTVTWGGAVNGTNLTLADFTAGNTLLATYIAAAQAAAAEANGAETNFAAQFALLNATQQDVVTATIAIEGGSTGNPGEADVIGSQTILSALTALKAALVVGTTDIQAAAAITAAWRAGAFGDPDVVALGDVATLMDDIFTAAGPFPMVAADVAEVGLILDPVINTATNVNNANQATLAAAIAANNLEVIADADAVGVNPSTLNDGDAADAVGAAETVAARTAAQDALDAHTDSTVTPLTTIQSALASLKAALAIGVTELQAEILIDNAQFAINTAIADAFALGVVIPAVDLTPVKTAARGAAVEVAPAAIDITEKQDLDVVITALQFTNSTQLAPAVDVQEDLQAVLAATTLAAAQAAAAAAASPFNGATGTSTSRAVWVLNTANQQAVTTTPGTGYVLAVNDERSVLDLKSDANNVYNFYAATVTVTFKDITATVNVPNTGFRTSDLQINQAIKDAINNNAVLNKLISAADGPANTLVITSLIDGVMSNANFGVALNLPALAGIVDVAGAAAVYGTASTAEAVLAAMQAAQTAWTTKGDYVDQLAETGAFGGNAQVTGRASVTTSDNTITPGEGNDVTVLGTTVGVEALLSSNDRVVFGAAFGNDTVVHFRAGSAATGGDVLVLSALGGSILGTAFNVNNSINVASETAATDTAAEVAALFADSATAQTHVYIAVDTVTNIGKVYSVTDAAGTAAGNVTATLQGTIDLADTLWSTLTIDNFA